MPCKTKQNWYMIFISFEHSKQLTQICTVHFLTLYSTRKMIKAKKTNETDFDLNLELIQEIHLVNCRQTGTPLRD